VDFPLKILSTDFTDFRRERIKEEFKAFKKRKYGDHFGANKLAAWDLYKSAFICGFGLPERVLGMKFAAKGLLDTDLFTE